MGVHVKYFVIVVFAAGFIYAADDAGSTSSQPADSKASTAQVEKTGLAKTKIITPKPKTNWSKIKDLFM